MYSVEFTKSAEKQFFGLEKDIQKRIISTLERIRIRPSHFIRKVLGTPYYRIRAGEYRIILDIKNERIIIMVIKIGHKKRIYKGV